MYVLYAYHAQLYIYVYVGLVTCMCAIYCTCACTVDTARWALFGSGDPLDFWQVILKFASPASVTSIFDMEEIQTVTGRVSIIDCVYHAICTCIQLYYSVARYYITSNLTDTRKIIILANVRYN